MAGSAEGESNPWPAFVDVLTTVIMVVTFMLVIMSAAIVTLSKRVIAEVREQTKAEAMAELGQKQGGAAAAISSSDQQIQSPSEAEDGMSIAERGSVLRQEQQIDGDPRLTARTRKVEETERVKVAAMEAAPQSTGVEVRAAAVLLEVDFEPDAVRYTPDAEMQVVTFSGRLAGGSDKLEIWSVAPQIASVSDAERIAFYRAILTRNLLVKAGVDPNRITTQVRVIDPSQGGHQVRVVVKP